MRCPHADRASKLVFDRHGNAFCSKCNPGPKPDRHVHTGKKIWAGSEVYTPSQLEEKAYGFGEKMKNAAAEHRKRHWRPSEMAGV